MGEKTLRRRSTLASRAARSRRRTPAAEIASLEPRLLLTAVPTSTALTASAVAVTVGQSVTLTATVTDAPGGATPTGGTVTFLDGSNVLGTMTLSGGTAHLTTSALAAGAHKLAADYAGDGANFLGSTSLAPAAGLFPVVAGNLSFGDGASALNALLSNPTAVAVDSAGDVFIADTFHEVVRKVATDGTITTVAGVYIQGGYSGDGGAATSAHIFLPAGLAVDAAGDLFIADTGNNVVREVNTQGVISTVVTGLNKPTGLAFDASGNLFIADSGNDVVRRLSGGTLSIVAGTLGSAGSTGDGGPATSAMLDNPTAVAVGSSGGIFIADTNNNEIRKVLPNGTIVDFAGSPSGAAGGTFAVALKAPMGVALDPIGEVFISDTGDNRVLKLVGSNFLVKATGLNNPEGVAFLSSGQLYIADSSNNLVRQLSGGAVSIFAGTTNPGYAGNGGPGTQAELLGPLGVAIGPGGALFVADSPAEVIRKVSPANVTSTVAGSGTAGFAGDGGPATSARLYSPLAVAVDSTGNIYIADSNNSVIRKVTPFGVISTVAGVAGQFGSGGDGGPATSAQLRNPAGVAAGPGAGIFIADMNNNEIRKVTAAGTMITLAGSPSGAAGGTFGVALKAPTGVAVDSSGNVFIADTGDNRIVELKVNGSVAIVAGTGTAGDTGDGGPATSATLDAPVAVAVDTSGDLLIVDGLNNGVRLVSPSGLITTIASGGVPGPGGALSQLQPRGAAINASGNVFISDLFSAVVRKLTLQPLTVTVSPAGQSAATAVTPEAAPAEVPTITLAVAGPASPPAPQSPAVAPAAKVVAASPPSVGMSVVAAEQQQAWLAALDALAAE